MEKASIFLTTGEAIQAIITDFRQYDPQVMLFSGVIRLITNNQTYLKQQRGKNGAWINLPGKTHMKWLAGPELVDHMCDVIAETRWHKDLLADVCARVFQSLATPEIDDDTGKAGVRIETHMEDFVCQQCGRCCQFLDYQNEVTAGDVANWKASGRNDILKWVTEIRRDGRIQGYRAWVIPGTGTLAETCPFLDKKSGAPHWKCRIQDAKPDICRQFPLNRKHATMTGCRGFDRRRPIIDKHTS